jgi:hypothetical protein
MDHFGCGGVNQGHTVRASPSARTDRRSPSARRMKRAARGHQRQSERYVRLRCGAVYVFVRNGGRWQQQAYVKPSNPKTDAEFGHGVALSADGNTMVVSAYWESSKATGINGDQKDTSIPQAGAIYVFTRSRQHVDAAGLHQSVEHRRGGHRRCVRRRAISSASRSR